MGGLTRALYQQQPLVSNTNDLKNNRLKIYDFGKFTADYRRYYKLTPQTYFVYRLAGGVATALTSTQVTTVARDGSKTTETSYLIPYDKYLFVGGSSSVRAWKPRRLGVGSYTQYKYDPTNPAQFLRDENGNLVRDYNLEQPRRVTTGGQRRVPFSALQLYQRRVVY